MSWSLNEVEGLARKAARGAGLSWGLAEEAGRATRWLMAAGLPGADMLAGLLQRNDGREYAGLCPAGPAGLWQARDELLCPIICGATLSDHAMVIAPDQGVKLGPVSFPMLLLPFAAAVADLWQQSVCITWDGAEIRVAPEGRLAIAQRDRLTADQAGGVTIRVTGEQVAGLRAHVTRCNINEASAKRLTDFAHRTYAPETPESRLAGAGAGLHDND